MPKLNASTTLCVAAGILLASLTPIAASAQFNIDDGSGNVVNIGPNGIQVRSGRGETVDIGGRAGSGVQVRSGREVVDIGGNQVKITPGAKSYRRQSSTVVRSSAAKAVAGTGAFTAQIGAIETSMYGKQYSADAVIVRLNRLEKDVFGSATTGAPVPVRIAKLRSATGTNGTVNGVTSTRSTNVINGLGTSVGATANGVSVTVDGNQITSSAQGQEVITINDNNAAQTLTLTNGNVVINSNGCDLQINGRCASLTLNGNSNVIRCQELLSTQLNGDRNRVTYRGGKPAVVITGSGNSVEENR